MKKIYSTLLGLSALLAAGPAIAGVTDTGKMFAERPRFMPAKFTNTDKTQFVVVDDDNDNGSTTFGIYDSSFGKIKDITTPVYPEVTATTTVREALRGPINVTEVNKNEWETGIVNETEFKDYCEGNGYTTVEQHGSETWYLAPYEWSYYYYDIYGTKYPTRYFVWKNGAGYEVSIEYSAGDWGYTGSYGEPYTYTQSEQPDPEGMDPRSETSTDADYIYITQTLFNSDDLYEWIIPVWEAVDCSYQTPERKVEGQELRIKSFKVMSENGSTVATIELPAGFYCTYSDLYLYMVGEENYLLLECKNEQTSDWYYAVYSISSTTGRMELVGEPMKVRVSPTAPRRGTPVNVSLGKVTANCNVTVVSTDGRTVMSRNVQPGTTSLDIATDNFRPGMYIVNVTDGKSTREATKIIVR